MAGVVNIGSDLSGFSTHGKKTFGAVAAQLLTEDFPIEKGIKLKAATGNAGIVFVGTTPVVTAGSDDDHDGFPLGADEEMTVQRDKTSSIYCIGSAADQVLYWFAQ